MSVKKPSWLLFLHLELLVLGTSLFILLFQTSLFKEITVFFYRGVLLLFLASLIIMLTGVFVRAVSLGKIFSLYDVILSTLLVFSINLVFFTHVPVTADRSISVFILGYMNKYSGNTLSQEEIGKAFSQKYINDYGAIGKRLEEQMASGNIIEEGSEYRITRQGKLIIRVYDFIADIFGIDKRNISP